MSCLIEESHELVEVHDEFLLDTIRPVILLKELLGVLLVHLLKQVVQWVRSNLSKVNALFEILRSEWHVPVLLNKEAHLVVLWVDTLVIELWGSHVTSSQSHVFEVIPEEKTSFFLVFEEGVHPLIVVNFPLLIEVEVLKTFGQM